MTSIIVMDLPDATSAILQANESLYHPNNKYTIVSVTQMREQGVEVNDNAKRHNGLQNVIVDSQEIPLKIKKLQRFTLCSTQGTN